MSRVYNFSAGPAVLPEEVLKEVAEEMMDYQGTGMSVMEMSHRSADFQKIIDEAEQDLRDLMKIPDNYKVLFLQGGASQQFAAIPMNLMKNKVADYISKKVADKLNGMFKTDRENYEKYWDDISPFIKFGCLKDEKFGEKMKNSMLYKNLDHKYMTLEDIIKEAKGEEADAAKTEETKEEETKTDAEESKDTDAKEEEKTRIFYVTDEVQQSQYINMFKAQGQDAIILTHNIDSAFITYLEQKHQEVQFLRIDADVHDSLKDEVAEDEKEEFQKTTDSLVEIFRKELGNEKLDVKVEKLKDENVASMAVLSEENRRMQEMMKMYGMGGMDASMFGSQATLVLNANHPLVQFLVTNKDSENVSIICKQLYDLAMLAHKPLNPEEMTAFVKRSNDIMMLLTK